MNGQTTKLKTKGWQELTTRSGHSSVEYVVKGKYVYVRALLAAFVEEPIERIVALVEAQAHPNHIFTARETEVLGFLRQGMSNTQIAAHLGIGERTVKFHVSSLLRKTDSRSRYDLRFMAMSPPVEKVLQETAQ